MKNNLLWILIVLLLFISLPYFITPYEDNDEIVEGFKGGRRGGGRRGGGRRGGGSRHQSRKMIRHSGHTWRRPKFYRRSSYRRYPYYYEDYGYPYYSTYDTLSLPYLWGNPYGYTSSYNWFDFRNCPPGCTANSGSPTGFSCVGSNTGLSCLSDYDCSGCNVPSLTYY